MLRVKQLRMQAFLEVTKNYVSSQIFTSYIHKLQTDHNRLWLFKKQLCKNLALSGDPHLRTIFA